MRVSFLEKFIPLLAGQKPIRNDHTINPGATHLIPITVVGESVPANLVRIAEQDDANVQPKTTVIRIEWWLAGGQHSCDEHGVR